MTWAPAGTGKNQIEMTLGGQRIVLGLPGTVRFQGAERHRLDRQNMPPFIAALRRDHVALMRVRKFCQDHPGVHLPGRAREPALLAALQEAIAQRRLDTLCVPDVRVHASGIARIGVTRPKVPATPISRTSSAAEKLRAALERAAGKVPVELADLVRQVGLEDNIPFLIDILAIQGLGRTARPGGWFSERALIGALVQLGGQQAVAGGHALARGITLATYATNGHEIDRAAAELARASVQLGAKALGYLGSGGRVHGGGAGDGGKGDEAVPQTIAPRETARRRPVEPLKTPDKSANTVKFEYERAVGRSSDGSDAGQNKVELEKTWFENQVAVVDRGDDDNHVRLLNLEYDAKSALSYDFDDSKYKLTVIKVSAQGAVLDVKRTGTALANAVAVSGSGKILSAEVEGELSMGYAKGKFDAEASAGFAAMLVEGEVEGSLRITGKTIFDNTIGRLTGTQAPKSWDKGIKLGGKGAAGFGVGASASASAEVSAHEATFKLELKAAFGPSGGAGFTLGAVW